LKIIFQPVFLPAPIIVALRGFSRYGYSNNGEVVFIVAYAIVSNAVSILHVNFIARLHSCQSCLVFAGLGSFINAGGCAAGEGDDSSEEHGGEKYGGLKSGLHGCSPFLSRVLFADLHVLLRRDRN